MRRWQQSRCSKKNRHQRLVQRALGCKQLAVQSQYSMGPANAPTQQEQDSDGKRKSVSPRPAKLLRAGSGTASGRVAVKNENQLLASADKELPCVLARARMLIDPVAAAEQP